MRKKAPAGVSVQRAATVAALRVVIPPQDKQARLARLVELADEHQLAARRAAELRQQLAQETAMRALTA